MAQEQPGRLFSAQRVLNCTPLYTIKGERDWPFAAPQPTTATQILPLPADRRGTDRLPLLASRWVLGSWVQVHIGFIHIPQPFWVIIQVGELPHGAQQAKPVPDAFGGDGFAASQAHLGSLSRHELRMLGYRK